MRGRHSVAAFPDTVHWTRENLAWAAGLFEGEGCFSTSTVKGRRYARMRMTSTDVDVLERFRAVVGCGQISAGKISPSAAASGTKKQPYVWGLSGRLNVYAVGVALFPWLHSRRRARFTELVHTTMQGAGARSTYEGVPA